jgi:integrase
MRSMSNPSGKHRKQKRRHGEGSVPFLRRDHVRQRQYCCTLSLGKDSTGKRRRKSFFGVTQAEAERRRDDARRLLGLRLHPDALTMTVGDAMDRYLDTVRPPAVRATTYTRYRGAIDTHLRPTIGAVRLADLDGSAIRGAMPLWGKPHSRAYCLGRLRAVLELAVADRLAERNEASYVRPPRFVTRTAPTIAPADARAILAAFGGHRLAAFAVLALSTGMRRGELLGLRWTDVDLEAATVSVNHSLRYVPPAFRSALEIEAAQNTRLVAPKNGKTRLEPLPAIAVEALRDQQARQIAERRAAKVWSENGLVFADTEGRTMWPATVSYQVRAVLKAAGYPMMRLHDTRHGFATILAGSGVHPRVAQDLLGHSTIGQSMDYTSVLPASARDAAAMVDSALRRTS